MSTDLKLEAVVIPVSDVDRSKQFYERLGWRLDADLGDAAFRIVQFNPPGSDCSVQFGIGLTDAAPGSAQSLLVVSDVEAAHDDLAAKGAVAERGLPRQQRRLQPVGHLAPSERTRPRPTHLRIVPRVHRSRRQPLAAPGDHEPTAGAHRGDHRHVQLRRRAPTGPRACRGRARRAREANRRGRREVARVVRLVHVRGATRQRAPVLSDYDVIVLGAGAPGRALCGRARRGWAAGRDGRARARRRRVLLLGLHPVEDAAPPG